MIGIVTARLAKIEVKLSHTVLEREAYLLCMGEAQSLQALVENMQGIYRKHFNT